MHKNSNFRTCLSNCKQGKSTLSEEINWFGFVDTNAFYHIVIISRKAYTFQKRNALVNHSKVQRWDSSTI